MEGIAKFVLSWWQMLTDVWAECFCWAAAKQSGEKRELQLPSAGRPLCSTIDLLTEQKRPQVAKTNKCQSQCNCGSLPRSPRVQSLLVNAECTFTKTLKCKKKKSFSIFIPTSSWQQTSSDVPATVTSSRTPSSCMFSFFIAPPLFKGVPDCSLQAKKVNRLRNRACCFLAPECES